MITSCGGACSPRSAANGEMTGPSIATSRMARDLSSERHGRFGVTQSATPAARS
jgi:hypothetical protein